MRVTIIGGGPAGSAAGIFLGRAGCHVTLVEQHVFPRDKVCGECLSHLGYQVLGRLGMHPPLHHAAAVPLTRCLLHARDGQSAAIDLPKRMWGISRLKLDCMMLDEARRSGVNVLQPARCEGVGHGPCRVRDLRTNRVEEVEGDWVILADGRAALMPGKRQPTGDLGIKAHFNLIDAPPQTIELFGLDRHYLGVAPIEGGIFNVAFAVPQERVTRVKGNLDALFQEMRTRNRAMQERFRRSTRLGNWLASPLPRFAVAPRWPPRLLPIGNAAAAIEPIGGEGMGLALRSAELAAQALVEAQGHAMHPILRGLPTAYRKLWASRRAGCRAGAMVLSTPPAAALALRMLRRLPSLATPALQLIGK